MKFATAGHFEYVGIAGVVDTQGNVLEQFLLEALADLAAGHELAFAAGERRGVDHEVHGQRGFVHRNRRHALGALGVADRHPDADLVDTGDQHDVAGFGHIAAERSRPLKVSTWLTLDLPRFSLPYITTTSWFGLMRPHGDAPDAQLTDIGGVVERADLHLQRATGVDFRLRHVRGWPRRAPHVRTRFVGIEHRIAIQGRCIDHREIELFFGRPELVERSKV